jgi:hypothetical protein
VYRARPLFVNVAELNTLFVTGVVATGGVAVIAVSLTGAWRSAPGLLAFATALAFAVLPYGVLARTADSTVTQMAARVRAARGTDDAAIATYKVFVRNLVFYTGLKHTDIVHEEHLNQWLSEHPRALVVMSKADADRITAAGRPGIERLAELRYFNEGGMKVRMLLWPDATTDLETAVLLRITGPPPTASQD